MGRGSAGAVGKNKRAALIEDDSDRRTKRAKDVSRNESRASDGKIEVSSRLSIVEKLLGGMPFAEFKRDFFEKQPLLLRKSSDKEFFPEGVFSRAGLLQLAARSSLEYGKDMTLCRYVNGERENYNPTNGRYRATKKAISTLFDKKYSCQFYQPQRYVDELFEINGAFEEAFGCLAGASAYLTPPSAQALAPHHDDVDVFILQTEGRKRWKLYKPLVELAGEHSSDLSPSDIGEVWQEFVLEQGDVLYFPRGVIHQAFTDANEFSTHVTISVYQHTSWANFLEVVLPRVIRRAFDSDVSFRRGLPIGYLSYVGSQFPRDSDEMLQFKAQTKVLVERLGDWVELEDIQRAGDEASADYFANRLPPISPPNLGTAEFVLESRTRVRFRDRSHVRLVFGEDELKEPVVSLYHSTFNCRVHHMGICSCMARNGVEEEDDADEQDASSSASDEEHDTQDRGEFDALALTGPPQPTSLTFSGSVAPLLLRLYSVFPASLSVEELIAIGQDETEVRGLLLRLWSEGLLITGE